MSTQDFVNYMTRAKGLFLSKYNIPISNLQVIEDSSNVIKFLIEGERADVSRRLIVSVKKKRDDNSNDR